MKRTTYLLLGLFLLSTCNRPMKLLENGHSEKALKVSMNRLKKGKVKEDHLYVFEKSFLLTTEKDAQSIKVMRQKGDPALWLAIYRKAKAIDKRQEKAAFVLNRLNNKGYSLSMDFYPAKALLEEAADNVALYYYAKAQEYIPAALRDDRMAARQAHHWLEKVQEYRPYFKDTKSLAAQMYAIGTTHILLNPLEQVSYRTNDYRLFAAFFGNRTFPKRMDWKVLHLNKPEGERIDYRLDLHFDNIYVSWENETYSSCSNTVSVQDGYQEVEVWNEQDSTYTIERRPVYIDVSVTVNNFTQSKYASLKMRCNLIDEASETVENSFAFANRENWENCYSEVCGDKRALTSSCRPWTGSRAFFPGDLDLLTGAAQGLNYRFYRVLKKKVE